MSSIKEQLSADIKDTMRAKDQRTLNALRLISAAVKQIEVDERIELDDSRMLAILDKLTKQRQESIAQFKTVDRHDLVDQEEFELNIIRKYLPEPLTTEQIETLINEALSATNSVVMQDMSKVMAYLKPKLQGRANMAIVSSLIKNKLST